jgi:NAD(P)-dependent dehydrogenase (short-subunit alcohol dehydrogenase family)
LAVPADATRPKELRNAVAEAERLSGELTAVHFNAAVVRQEDHATTLPAEGCRAGRRVAPPDAVSAVSIGGQTWTNSLMPSRSPTTVSSSMI